MISIKNAEDMFEAFEAQLVEFDESHHSSSHVFDASYITKARDSNVFELTLIAKYNDPSRGRGFIDEHVILKDGQLSITPDACRLLAQLLAFKLLGIKV